jgi:hypothetical protein
MREITATFTAYGLDDLQPDDRRRVVRAHADTLTQCLEVDYVTDAITTQIYEDLGGKTAGHDGPRAYWSLSYCQGDGVALDGQLDRDTFPNFTAWPDDATRAELKIGGRYTHENSFTVTLYGYDADGVECHFSPDAPGVVSFTNELRTICRRAAALGYLVIDDATSETLAAYELADMGEIFTADGRKIPAYILDSAAANV